MINRRGLITGLISFVAAPAIVKASSIMPVKSFAEPIFVGVDLGSKDYTSSWILDSSLSYVHENIGEVWIPYTAEKASELLAIYGKILTKHSVNKGNWNAVHSSILNSNS